MVSERQLAFNELWIVLMSCICEESCQNIYHRYLNLGKELDFR